MTTVKSEGVALDWLWCFAWTLASSLWCLTAANALGATFDEPFYIAQGLEFWRNGTHGRLLSKGTMPLPVDLTTLPIYLWERWSGEAVDPVSDLEHVLPWARAATLLFWWLLLAYGWRIGRSLAGPWGGRLALALLAVEPTLLAHASLATTDLAVTACLMALAYHFRMGREAGWERRLALPACWYAAAVLAKASALVLGPLCMFVIEVERLARAGAFTRNLEAGGGLAWIRATLGTLKPFRTDAIRVCAAGLIAVFIFCGSDWKAEPSFVAWTHSLPEGPTAHVMQAIAEHLRIFPNAGQALVRQIQHNIQGHAVFLLGEVHRRAFWYYFPVALTMKLSVPLLILPLVILLLRPRALVNWATVTAAALVVFSLTSRVQIGIRLVLPLVGLAAVGLAAAIVRTSHAVSPGWRRRTVLAGATAGLLWTGSAAVLVWPHALCYTNQLWGGTERGYLLLSDSNCDWGQGLKDLARWQQAHGGAPLDVWYFGTDPLLARLPVHPLPLHALPIAGPEDVATRLHGRYLAASTTLLHGGYVPEPRRRSLEFLRARRPIDRTMTFLIYDFAP
ncbi:MAG: hypothetical protein ACE5Q3_09370 [Alphaproteobacteria bacterium]